GHFGRRHQPFRHSGKAKEQRKIEGSVNPDHIAVIIGPATDELGDLEFVVIHFAKRKKVRFADLERKFADRIAKDKSEIRLYVFQCIDAEAIDIPFRYRMLMTANQR